MSSVTSETQNWLQVLAVAQLGGRSPKEFMHRNVIFGNGRYIYRGIIQGFVITEKDGLVFTVVENGRSTRTKKARPDNILYLGAQG